MGKAQRRKMEAREALKRLPAQLKPIYDRLPELNCLGKCFESCGPIHWTVNEAALAERQTGKPAMFVQEGQNLRCTYLDADRRCEVYAIRPLICRMFGQVEKMKCPFGCEPERWLSDDEARAMFGEILPLVGGYLAPRAAASVETWIRLAIERIAEGDKASGKGLGPFLKTPG